MFNRFPTSFRHYDVLKLLGDGSFAVVYLARDTHLRRLVALKMLHPDLAAEPDMVRRFLREARAMAGLDHVNIVRVNRVESDPQEPFFEMEYVEGQTLADYRGGRVLSLQEAISILKQMAAALDAAHQQGIVHRDIKPANVLIKPDGQVKLTDFGIMKLLRPIGTAPLLTHGVAGTPNQMAPEQADENRKHEIGPASDIYALGVVSYKLLTGRLPFERSDYRAVIAAHATQAPPDPRTFNRDLPAPVASVLLKVLAKQPRDRYPSAMAFVEALEQAGWGRTPINPPPPDPVGGLAAIIRQLFAKQSAVVWPIVITLAMVMAIALGQGLRDAFLVQPTGEQPGAEQPTGEQPAAEQPTAEQPTAEQPAAEQPAAPSEATATPILGIGSTMVGQDGMILLYVPKGKFIMGSREDDPDAFGFEQPQHEVYLDAFWIGQTEVTNQMYAACVAAGKCDPPSLNSSLTRNSYYDNPEYSNYPVIKVSWYDAHTYCEWAGRRLPTEAEWEKAARGTDGRIYPWGDKAPSQDLLNFNFNVGDTTAVGSYPAGASPYGALDMAGNVWEWVADWYDEQYYAKSPESNPHGPSEGTLKALRGGSWYGSEARGVRAGYRAAGVPAVSFSVRGLRCARSPLN